MNQKGRYKRTEEHKKLMSKIKLKNNPLKGVSSCRKGIFKFKITKEELAYLYLKKKMSLSEIGKKYQTSGSTIFHYMKRYEIPSRKLSDALKLRDFKNEKHPNWKNQPKIPSLHRWIEKNKSKPLQCEICKRTIKLELSCTDHKYTRNIEDYEWLCRSCHRKKDFNYQSSPLKNMSRWKEKITLRGKK